MQESNFDLAPQWLKPLLTTKYFSSCFSHRDSNKNECNLYCLDCMGEALCTFCTTGHRNHRIVQIRRSSYHDCIRVSEIHKILDIAEVQTYIINSARVVFLNERPQPRLGKGVTNTCAICERSLLDNFMFCSLGCKLEGVKRQYGKPLNLHPNVKNYSEKSSDSDISFYQKKTRSKRSTMKPLVDENSNEEMFTGKVIARKNEKETLQISYSDSLKLWSELSPRTPPQIFVYRNAKRRKGTPHRSPLGS